MGASNSKQEPVVVYGNEIPIGFTQKLSDKLVKDATSKNTQSNSDKSNTTPTPTPPADSQDLTAEIEKGVATELSRILEKSQLDDMKSKERQTSTSEMLAEIRDTAEKIKNSPLPRSKTFEKSMEARDKLVACLKASDGKPLNCWSEVGEFERLVKDIEREFVDASK